MASKRRVFKYAGNHFEKRRVFSRWSNVPSRQRNTASSVTDRQTDGHSRILHRHSEVDQLTAWSNIVPSATCTQWVTIVKTVTFTSLQFMETGDLFSKGYYTVASRPTNERLACLLARWPRST